MSIEEPGARLGGRYTLVRRIAGGGMGEVWEARDDVLERSVAAKVIKPELAEDESFGARFRSEARLAAKLGHANIAQVHDFGESGDRAYLVMELVPGTSLSAMSARSGPMPPPEVARLLAQAAQALQCAHEHGVVHRDVKPANILVTPSGVVKLTDFGIARALGETKITRAGEVLGTPQYMAPEAALGREVTPAADIYSLGVVAYELLAGRRPFTADSAVSLAMQHVNEPPPELPERIPAPVRSVVMRALSKDPAQRQRTVAALGEDLVAAARWSPQGSGESPTTRLVTPPTTPWVAGDPGNTPTQQTPQPGGVATPRPAAGTTPYPTPGAAPGGGHPAAQGSSQGGGYPTPTPQPARYTTPPPQQGGYSTPPPQGGGYRTPTPQPGGYSTPPPQQGSGYRTPPPQQGGYSTPPPQGGGYRPPTPAPGSPPPGSTTPYPAPGGPAHGATAPPPGFVGTGFPAGASPYPVAAPARRKRGVGVRGGVLWTGLSLGILASMFAPWFSGERGTFTALQANEAAAAIGHRTPDGYQTAAIFLLLGTVVLTALGLVHVARRGSLGTSLLGVLTCLASAMAWGVALTAVPTPSENDLAAGKAVPPEQLNSTLWPAIPFLFGTTLLVVTIVSCFVRRRD